MYSSPTIYVIVASAIFIHLNKKIKYQQPFLLARPNTLKSKLSLRLQPFFSKILRRHQPEIRVWFPIVSWFYLLYMVNPVVPKVYCAVSLGIREHFPGDPWIHVRNGYFEVHSFFKLK
jgi:hypothetical protein